MKPLLVKAAQAVVSADPDGPARVLEHAANVAYPWLVGVHLAFWRSNNELATRGSDLELAALAA